MTKVTAKTRARLRERDGDACFFCGFRIRFDKSDRHRWGPTIHHVKPKRDGGTNALDNLKLAHCRCHREHHGTENAETDSHTFGYPSYWALPEVTPGRERLP
jgi:5-methylcytosine-specific restriction endonuclease McrA